MNNIKSFIIENSIVGNENSYLLKLNRVEKKLELYKKTENEKLHSLYSIRSDFNSENYIIYQLENSFNCLYGGNESPTPYGIFKVVKKSEEEYISGYRKDMDKVKFFGYLVIFEDYFIHSDIYNYEVTKDTIDTSTPISHDDTETSGCIRVSQTEIQQLLDVINVGTTVIFD